MKRLFLILLVLIISVTIVGVGVFAYLTFTYPGLYTSVGTSTLPCPAGATGASGQTHYTIIISSQGFNGSKYSSACPLISLSKGQTVTIHVVNNDGERHGVAIMHYLAGGVEVQPGQSKDITFTADQVGSFTIYCNIGCFVHNYQQNGRFNVTG